MEKRYKFSAAAIAAAMVATIAGSQTTGAIAQDSEIAVETDGTITDERVPVVFTAEEVVQPLPDLDAAGSGGDEGADAPVSADAGLDNDAPSTLRELVAQTPTSGTLSRQLECLAGAIYFEARGEPIAGQLAVGRVVINRTEDHRFPDSYCDVVTQRAQFSFVRGGRIPTPNRASTAWKRAKAIAKIAHQDLWDSEAGDSLYFHANYVNPSWARRMAHRATIKTHIFYR